MALDNESFNKQLYDLLKVRGYKPVSKNSKNQDVEASQLADVVEFQFIKDGESYGKAWVSIDDAQNVIVYYSDEQADSPEGRTPGMEYDDSWSGFLQHLKSWAHRKQLSFELLNKDRLNDDMRQREYLKMKENINEGYYPMGKQASYNDSIPTVKIVLQHTRHIQEGEQRYRNVAKIFLENQLGERILAPTTRPGIAQVYARHLAEGGVANDERWNHIKSICEEYQKMAGFVRATRNGQFNESAQQLVNEGVNHYNNLRETLGKLRGHRGYNAYFESWTPTLMEDESEETNLNELFVQETVDPRIESVMPILSRLRKNIGEMSEVKTLESWADGVINQKLEEDSTDTPLKDMDDYKAKKKALQDLLMDPEAAKDPNYKKLIQQRIGRLEQQKAQLNMPSSRLDPQRTGGTALSRAEKYADEKMNKKTSFDPDKAVDIAKGGALGWGALTSLLEKDQELDEGSMKHKMMTDAERMSLEQFCEKYGDEDWIKEFWRDTNGVEEGLGDVAKKVGSALKTGAKAVGKAIVGKDDDELLRDLQKKAGVRGMNHGKPSMAYSDVEKVDEEGVAEAGNKPLEKSRIGTGDTRTPRELKTQMQGASDEFVKSTADKKTGPFHSRVAKMQGKLAKSELRRREQGVAEDLDSNQKRVGQLGPTKKVGKKGAVGKLVGANESADKSKHPKTWHDVDKKLGKEVDKMSQDEKVKKGFAHPDTLKKKVKEGQEDLDAILRIIRK